VRRLPQSEIRHRSSATYIAVNMGGNKLHQVKLKC